MTSYTARREISDEQKVLIKSVGRAIWRSELTTELTLDERRFKWREGHRTYMGKAKKLVRAFQREGLMLTKHVKSEEKLATE